MRTFTKLILVGVVLLGMASPGQAQTVLTHPTFGAAVSATQTTITLSSSVGVLAGHLLVVPGDQPEVMTVTSVPSATTVTVMRGRVAAYPNALQVFTGPGNYFRVVDPPGGVCIWTSIVYAPWINTNTGAIWTCAARSPAGVASTWRMTSPTVVTYNSIGQLW